MSKKHLLQLNEPIVQKLFSRWVTKRRNFRLGYKVSIRVYWKYYAGWTLEEDREEIRFWREKRFIDSKLYKTHRNNNGDWDCDCADYCVKRTKRRREVRNALLSLPTPNLIGHLSETGKELPMNSGNTLRMKMSKE